MEKNITLFSEEVGVTDQKVSTQPIGEQEPSGGGSGGYCDELALQLAQNTGQRLYDEPHYDGMLRPIAVPDDQRSLFE